MEWGGLYDRGSGPKTSNYPTMGYVEQQNLVKHCGLITFRGVWFEEGDGFFTQLRGENLKSHVFWIQPFVRGGSSILTPLGGMGMTLQGLSSRWVI
ncbi:hypothetical protein Csa_001889 [Cucumis sativus]|uniref:Uncharacterized protein n=1 Tax=Cucumis sativus TaxID=3659 RepID=A0A0A0LHT0_CUCSA|nr:hypothetical protein Csa_001889 [Cucumis sativus]